MRVRLRAPTGVHTVTISDDATVEELVRTIQEKTSLSRFEVKRGYPPQLLETDSVPAERRLADTGWRLDGEQLIIVPGRSDSAQQLVSSQSKTQQLLSDSQLAAALSRQEEEEAVAPVTAPSTADAPELPIPSHGGRLVLRVMPDDNSCLFRAFGSAVLGAGLDCATELRALVAQEIQSQPDMYTAAILQRPTDQYCRWIQMPDSWGGAIELGILSMAFGVEICSINVQDLRVDRFNEGAERRCLLVYSGIHYDTIAIVPARNPFEGAVASSEEDSKIFDSKDQDIVDRAIDLCRVLQSRHYYTDTGGFTVKCLVCGWKGKGERGATKHAKESKHYEFGEA